MATRDTRSRKIHSMKLLLVALLLATPVVAQMEAGYLLWEFDTGG